MRMSSSLRCSTSGVKRKPIQMALLKVMRFPLTLALLVFLSDNYQKQSQFNTVFYRINKVDRVG
jgi:hypothetical protein